MKTILFTGCLGFIGSHFIEYFHQKYNDVFLINLDKLTYSANKDNLFSLNHDKRYQLIKGDICDEKLVKAIFHDYQIGSVIHFAAESHVDNSIENPDIFIKTNINGTYNLLNHAYHYWMDAPFQIKEKYKWARFHHISTDEVYGSLGKEGLFTEKTPYAPNSPYSASKAAGDMLVRSYYHTYGLNSVTTNCSNNFGTKQHDEKLIPTVIRSAIFGDKIRIYGRGENIRDWLYVIDHCEAIDLVFDRGRAGETYNIGTNNELTNNEIVELICNILNKLYPVHNNPNFQNKQSIKQYQELIEYVKDRPGHDLRYAIDSTKIKTELQWEVKTNFDFALEETVKWYIAKYSI